MDLSSEEIELFSHCLNGKNFGEQNNADKEIWRRQQKTGFYKEIVNSVLRNETFNSKLFQLFVRLVSRRWLQELDGFQTEEFIEEVKKPFTYLLFNLNSSSNEKHLLEVVKKVAERSKTRDEWLEDFLMKNGSILAIQVLVVFFKAFNEVSDNMKNSNERLVAFIQESLEKSYKTDALMTTAVIRLIKSSISHIWGFPDHRPHLTMLVFESCMHILEQKVDSPDWLECQKSTMKLIADVSFCGITRELDCTARLFEHISKRLENITKEHCDDEMYGAMLGVVRMYSDVHKFKESQKPSYLLSDLIISKALDVDIDEEASMCMNQPQSYAKSLIADYFKISYITSLCNVRLNSLCRFLREAVVYSSDYEHPAIKYMKDHQHWFTEGSLKEEHFIWSLIFSLLDDGDGVCYNTKRDVPFFDAQLKALVLRSSHRVLKQRLQKDSNQHPLVVCDVIKFLQWQRKQYSVEELKDLTDIMASLLKVETHQSIIDMCLFFLHKTLSLQNDTTPAIHQNVLRHKLEELVDGNNYHQLKHTFLYLKVVNEILKTLERRILPIPEALYRFLKGCFLTIVESPTDKKLEDGFVSLVFGCINHLASLCFFESFLSIDKNGVKSDNDLLDNFNDHFLEMFRDVVYHRQHQDYHLFILFMLVKTLSHSETSLKNELTWAKTDISGDSSYKMEELTDVIEERRNNLNNIYLPIIARFFPSNNFSTAPLWWDKACIDSLVFCAQVYIRKFAEKIDKNTLIKIGLQLLDGPYDFCAKGLRVLLAVVEVMNDALLKNEFIQIIKTILAALHYNGKRSFLLAICTFFGIMFSKLDVKFIVETCDSIRTNLFRELCTDIFLTSILKVGSYTDKSICSHLIIGALEYFSSEVLHGREVEKEANIDYCIRFMHLATVTKKEFPLWIHKHSYDGSSEFYCEMGIFFFRNEVLYQEKPNFIEDSLKRLFEEKPYLIGFEEYKTIKLEEDEEEDAIEKSRMKTFLVRNNIANVPALSAYPDYEYYE